MRGATAVTVPAPAARPAHRVRAAPQRPWLHVPIRDEAVLDRPRDRPPEEPLNAAEKVRLVDAHQADRVPGLAGPTRPPDPVDVVLRVPRQLEVHDVRQVLDVEPPRSDVGRDEDADRAGLELLERPRPLRLRAVTVDRDRIDPVPVQPGGEAGGGDLRPREDQDLAEVLRPDEVGEELLLPVTVHGVHDLPNRVDRRVPWRDLDLLRIAQDRPRQPADVVGEGRREHQVLAAGREQVEDPLDVRQEAHVEHPVGLVEDEDLHLAQVRDALADEVEEPAGRRDEDLDAGAERLHLGFDRDAAVHDRRPERDRPAVRPDAGIDLHRELAGRDEDQHADRVAGR